MDLPWDRARKQKHELQEERLSKHGKKQINSGRTTWRSKRDVSLWDLLLVEARRTDSNSISISRPEWQSIRREASSTPPGLLGAMQLEIQNDVKLLVLDWADAESFFEELQDLREQVKQIEYRTAHPSDSELPEMFEAFQADSGQD